MEGGGGSGKTFDVIQFVITYCDNYFGWNKDILIGRDQYSDCKKTILKDFMKILKSHGIYDIDNHVQSNPQSYKLYGNIIYFSGINGIGSHGERHDVVVMNEILEMQWDDVSQINQRCNELFIGDYNPRFTDHWVYDKIESRDDCKLFMSTQLMNPFLPKGQRDEILAYEPTTYNIKKGTADDYLWAVYGLGKRAAPEGIIFKYVNYIDSFPDMGYCYGMDFGWTCFAGETLIETIIGPIKIKDIKCGDKVLTRKGYKKVLKKFDNGIKKVIKKNIGLDFGYKKIIATFDHNFNVNGKWKKFGNLIEKDNLCVLSNLTERYTKDTQADNIHTITSINGRKMAFISVRDCIMRYINFIMEKYRKAIIFTTATLILLIMTPIIWLLSLPQNIVKCMIHWESICSQISVKRIGVKTDTLKTIGLTGENQLLKSSEKKLGNVNFAQTNIYLQTHIKDSVIKNVTTDGNMLQKSIKLKCNAKLAIQNLWAINIRNQKHAAINVLMRYQSVEGIKTISDNTYEQVYDLQIEGVNEYFANGILVHNCDPTTIVKVGETRTDIYLELLCYEPIETPDTLDLFMNKIGIEKHIPITADSSDKYTGENKGTVEMVKGLRLLGWPISKVHKTKSIMFWLNSMKRKRINVVNNHLILYFKKEFENYRMKVINGIAINQPIDKFDHAITAGRYGHMSLNQPTGIKSRKV
ncbi:MAG: hypothetical protein IID16_00970 [Candidatus Marinimicrobia bacterium]|nr:hypothetical protein [Candidatus Neomarinimicrobiota bacterium]